MTANMKKIRFGFLLGGGLVLLGVLMEVLLGPIKWSALAWPVNILVLAASLVIIGVMYALRRRVPFFEWMMHYGAAVPAMVYALALTLIMGLTTQSPMGGLPWISRMVRFWPFTLAWGWVMLISGLTTLNHLMRFKLREIPFVLNHLGVFVAVVAATFGSGDGPLSGLWLKAVYAGILMMMAGAICLMMFMAPKPPKEEEGK